MHDDELRRQMRALDADFAPDPHFADSLFTQLTVEARGGRTGSGRLVLLLAAALLIVALGAGVVLGSGMLKLPLVADESGSPVPSPSPIASPGEPTPSSAPD